MAVQNAAGDEYSDAGSLPLTEVEQAKVYTVDEDVYQTYDSPGSGSKNESQTRLVFPKGAQVTQAEVDALFPEDAEDTEGDEG